LVLFTIERIFDIIERKIALRFVERWIMRRYGSRWLLLINLTLICSFLTGCGILSRTNLNPQPGSNPTPTATEILGAQPGTKIPTQNPCQGLEGSLDLQILVGPSEAVGLEPVTVGEIPFVVLQEGDSYLVEGGGPLQSYSDVLTANWGTYTVTFEGDTIVTGECVLAGEEAGLVLTVEMSGDQNVEIIYEGTQMNYPWSGTTQIEASLPIQDGAQQQGEGWVLILHLNK
jgi:hypothetical protein